MSLMGNQFGWDYPPGVSGLEPAIYGAEAEMEEECPRCGKMAIAAR